MNGKFIQMAGNEEEIRRIEGQLLVAKQLCRENLKEINQLKKQQQENDYILHDINRLLLLKTLNSNEHIDQFNQLLRLIYERQRNTFDGTIQWNEQEEKNAQDNSLLVDLSSNIAELESLFDYAKTLFTQPITSINMLDNTVSLQEMTDDDSSYNNTKENDSIQLDDLQKRIDKMHKKLSNIDQCDDCLIQ